MKSVRWLTVLFLLLAACGDNSGTKPPVDGPPSKVFDSGRRDGPKPPGTDGGTAKDLGPPPPPPAFTNAHVDPGCSSTIFQVNAGTVATTCANLWTTPGDVLQVTVGEATDTPPPAGRVYVVKPQSQVNIYPADGEATAVYIKTSGSLPVVSGSFTISPYTAGAPTITGSYLVQTSDGATVRGSFRADTCPVDPGSCQ